MATPLRPPADADDKFGDIRSITDAALSYLDADDLLTVLLRRVRQALDADTAAVLLLDRSGRYLVATAATGLEEEVTQGVRIPVGGGFAGRIAAERRPVILERVDSGHVLNSILLDKGIKSMVGVPLLANGAPIGVMHVGTLQDRVFTEEDADLLQLAADRAALAVQSMRSREDRAAVAAIQRSLLPSAPPSQPGVEIAARYVPGDGQVGGDWYDVFPLPGGELGIVVGDVAGSGLGGAIIMGRMRSALRSYALEFPDPADVLSKLDHKMQYFEDDVMATVSYAVLYPASGKLRLSSAGHYPPVIAAPGRRGVLAEIAVDAPIGVADNPPRRVTTCTLVPGSVLCFYTDGLVERRDRPLDDRIARLCDAVSAGPPDGVCVSVMGTMVGREHPGDDTALLVLRWQPAAALPAGLPWAGVTDGLPADLRAAAALGGEMGRRVLAFRWAEHPLGVPEKWSASMRTTVATALASRFPTVVWLGEPLYLVYNDAYIPVLGEKHPAALGGAGAEIWWDIWDVIGPMLDSVVRSGVATWSDDLMLMLDHAGRREERYFTFTYSPIIGGDGRTEGVFCAVTETTERVLGARRLQALNALAAGLIDVQSADDALTAAIAVCAVHDADLPFAAVYLPAGLYRATPAAAGLLPLSLSPLLDGPGIVGGLRARLPGLAARLGQRCPEQALVIGVGEIAGEPPAATLVLGLNSCRPLDDQYLGFCRLLADQVSAALASVRAYEAERRRAESLAALDRAKTAFLTNVSHEFRTPLTLMLGPLDDLIATTTAADDRTAERLDMIRRNGRRLLRLVNALLDFSRIEAGQATPRPEPADVGALTAGLASSFADVCRMAGIDLILDCRPAWAEVDPAMWETIVLNLVSNAFKHTFSGSIAVRAGPGRDGGAEIVVADTGTGIAADHLPHLFERFYRAAGTPGRSAEGSGIGLALVKSLVEMHHGEIEVNSALGVGTVVTVWLPQSRDLAPDLPGPPRRPAAGDLASAYVDEALQWLGPTDGSALLPGRPLVLIADDNADMRRYLAEVLGRRWSVLAAGDGRQALDLARRYHPDLLVTDVMMPVMDGFDLVAAIRADPALAPLPVIMLSARAGIEAAGEGVTAGADNYLVKPFSSADLVNSVAARLRAAGRDRSRPPRDDLAARRGLALADLGTALADTQTLDEILRTLLGSPQCSLGATGAAAGVLDRGRGLLRITYSGDVPAEAAGRYRLVDIDAPLPIADAVRAGQRLVLAEPDARQAGLFPGARAAVIEPLHAEDGSVLGAIALTWPEPRQFGQADVGVIERAVGMAGRAVARIAVAEREHEIALALQERLLDLGAGSLAAVMSALYQPAGETMRVGGDWYTVTPINDHCIGVSVGDVVGHGLPAAAVMSQLRSALGAAALAATEPAAVLDVLDRYARSLRDATFATVAYAIIDTAEGTVDYTCAGHPYPLIVTADGAVSYLREGRRAPLAARSWSGRPSTGRTAIPPGSLLLLYTDGLIERRAESLDAGFARLAAAAADCALLPAGAACDRLLARLAGDKGYGDDVAMVAVRPVGTTATSHVDALRASFAGLGPARDRFRAWLRGLGVPPARAYHILLGTGEALSNAIEHGSGLDSDRIVGLEAFAGQREIAVTVTDSGHWTADSAAPPAAPEADRTADRTADRGRGLPLIHGLSDDVQTVRTPLGTRVTMTYRLDLEPKS